MIKSFLVWFKQLFTKQPPKPVYNQGQTDDRIIDCILWLEKHPAGNHYVACRLLPTVERLQKAFPNANITTVQRLATGWSTHSENAFLCCTTTIRSQEVATQLRGRLRASTATQNTLIFTNQGANRG